MSFLLDTNVVSELRKGERADQRVVDWTKANHDQKFFLSVLVIGEIRKGVDRLEQRVPGSGQALNTWLSDTRRQFAGRVIPIDEEIAERWGKLSESDPPPAVDALMAATALVRNLTLVTRNTRDIERTGVPCFNPFG